ncbi:MAG: c-type cytochrome [Elusimicrobiota bacterium]|jgi:cytochrome c6
MRTLALVLLASLTAPAFAADAANGKKLFDAKCATCHGKDGKGSPAMQKMLKVGAAALDVTKAKDFAAVTENGRGKMPAYKGKLSSAEIADLQAHIGPKTAPKAEAKAPEAAADSAPAAVPAAGSGEGKKLYDAKCASCHGKDGKGSAAMAKVLKTDAAGLDMLDAASLGEKDEQWLEVTKKGAGKMPAYGAKLSDAEIMGILSHVRGLAPKTEGK